MIDGSKMNVPEYGDNGEFCSACVTLHDAAEILHTADRIPDETTKAPLVEGARKMLQNVIDALDGRRTDGMVIPEANDDD